MLKNKRINKKVLTVALFSGLIFTYACEEDEPLNDPPEACFDISMQTPKVSDEITFTNCSKNADTYIWDFGDGNNSTQQEPTHTYSQAGSFEVQLLAGSANTNGMLNLASPIDSISTVIVVAPLTKSIELTIKDGTSWTPASTALSSVQGATINLYNNQSSFDNGTPDMTATSDENGQVILYDLANGTYLMVVTKDDLSNIKDNFLIKGVFQSQEDIDNSPVHPGKPQPGDLKFADLNGDFIISNDDQTTYKTLIYKGELITEDVVIGK